MTQTSAQLKLARGIEHVNTVRAESITFEHADAYVPAVKRNIRSPREVEYVVTAVERVAPPFDWPILAYNMDLRCAALTDPTLTSTCNVRGDIHVIQIW